MNPELYAKLKAGKAIHSGMIPKLDNFSIVYQRSPTNQNWTSYKMLKTPDTILQNYATIIIKRCILNKNYDKT
jgi:hypothetical protein